MSSLIATGRVKVNLKNICHSHVTLCDHVINRFCDQIDNKLALESTTLLNLVVIGLAEVEI